MALELTSSFEVVDPRFRKLALAIRARREALHRLPLGRGTGLVRGRALPGLVRHSQRPHAALGRDRRLGLGVPPAGDEQQRPHGRPAGPAGLVRAPRPLRVAHRVRRHAHRAGRPLRRQALQLAQRRGGEVRRQHLVHRPELRHRLATTKATRRRARSAPATSTGSTRRAARSTIVAARLRAAQRARVLARRVAAVHRRHRPHAPGRTGRTTCGASRCRPTAGSISGGEVFATCPVGLYDGFRVDVHGNLWLSAGDGVHCHAPRRHAARQDPDSRSRWPTCASAGRSCNRLFICGTTSLYSVFLNTRAAPRGLISER